MGVPGGDVTPGKNEPGGKSRQALATVPTQQGQGEEGQKVQEKIRGLWRGPYREGEGDEKALQSAGHLGVERRFRALDVGAVIGPGMGGIGL